MQPMHSPLLRVLLLQEAIMASKLDAMTWEFNHLLASQLDSQRQYFEQLMLQQAEAQEAR